MARWSSAAPWREPSARWRSSGSAPARPSVAAPPHTQSRAVGGRSGILAARPAPRPLREALAAWKRAECPAGDLAEQMTAELVALLRAWQPLLPGGWVLTTPPQGASAPGPYGAAIIARRVATDLDLDLVTLLERTDLKRHHGRHESLRQAPYRVTVRPAAPVLVVDDLITSRTTMRLSLEALAAAGVAAWGFAWGVTVGRDGRS